MAKLPRSASARLSHRLMALGWLAIAGSASFPAAANTQLRSQASSLCLDVMAGGTANGTPVQIWTCHAGTNQVWNFNAAGELRGLNGTRCLGLRRVANSSWLGAASEVCSGDALQRWTVLANGSIRNVSTGQCLDVVGDRRTAGTAVQAFTCHGRNNQIWLRADGVRPDQQAPTPPSFLQTSGLTCRSVNLSWSASTDNVGVTAYEVSHDGQFMTSVGGNARSANLVLTPGVRWNLYVNARDSAGNVSQASPTLALTVPQCNLDAQAPSVPTGLTGSITGTSASISWRAATDNVAVTAYDVFRDGVRVGSTPNLNYIDPALVRNTAYRYTVAARDAQGNLSARSVALSLTTGSACNSVVCAVTTLATDSQVIWGLAPMADGNVIYGRRDGKDLFHVNARTGLRTALGVVPNVDLTGGEGGLLGLAVTANFPTVDPWLYIFHTSPTDNRIVRVRYINGALDFSSLQVLLSGIPRNIFHNGGRLRFGPDGMLYAATGDALNREAAQDVQSLLGKVLRLNPNGGPPLADNPFGNHVWSYGHRNPQGLAFDSQGRLWGQEFGESDQDETNLIERGGNYGWPQCEGTLSISGLGCQTPGFKAPKFTYRPVDGSCSGIAIVRDALYVGCLRGSRLYRHVISGDTLTGTQQLFVGTYGRIRAVEPTPDGGLWLGTNGFDRILKVDLGN